MVEFVAYVEAGKYVEAIHDFYAETAFMKENLVEPRVGRENPIGHERAVRARLPQIAQRAGRSGADRRRSRRHQLGVRDDK